PPSPPPPLFPYTTLFRSTPTLTVGANGGGATFSGVLKNTAGTLSLTKAGSGTQTLTGTAANTFSGITTINAGELDLGKTAGINADRKSTRLNSSHLGISY